VLYWPSIPIENHQPRRIESMLIESSSLTHYRQKASPSDILSGGPGKPATSFESLPLQNTFHGKRPMDRGHRGSVSQVRDYEDSNPMDCDHSKSFYNSSTRKGSFLNR